METKTPKVGVGVFLTRMVENEKTLAIEILLGKRLASHGIGEYSLPGGHVEFMESPEDACVREVFEETGLKILDVRRFDAFPYTNDFFPNDGKHYITLFFTAHVSGGVLQNREKEKCESWDWYDVFNLPSPLFPPLVEMTSNEYFSSILLLQLEKYSL